MPETIVVEGVKVNPATGFPMGRPPSDPTKRKVWEKLKKEALIKKLHGETPDLIADDEEVEEIEEEPTETDEEILAAIKQRFVYMRKFTAAAAQGSTRALIVSGSGGLGKTYTVEDVLSKYEEDEGVIVELHKAVVSPVHLYMLLYRQRHKNCVTVLDDADGVFFDEDSLSLMKAALDTTPKRKISWMSRSPALKEAEIPTSFNFEGAVIFITNLDFQRMVDIGRGKLVPHLQALMTRALYLDLRLHRARDIGLWVNHLVTTNKILQQEGLSASQEADVMMYINEHRKRFRNLSIRTALKLAGFVMADPKQWREMAEQMELR